MLDTLTLSSIPKADAALRPLARALADECIATMPVDRRIRSWQGVDVAFSRRLGEAGLLGLTLPERYGGGGRGPFARFVVVEEFLSAGAPVAAHWIADRQSAPLILRFGTEAQRERYLPPIARGEAFFCVGMSESEAGSDLANVRTRAERIAGGWRVNGRKLWINNAIHAHYMVALVRTSPDPADRHAGLSQLIIDLGAPGVSIQPIVDLNGETWLAEVVLDDVEVPEEALIGQEGGGWDQIMAELAYERSGPERIYSSIVLLDAWIAHVAAFRGEDPVALSLVGEFSARLATLRALAIACAGQLEKGLSPLIEASLIKNLGTQFEHDLPLAIGADLAAHPGEPISPELYRALRFVTHIAPAFLLRGGTREILRGVIARGLGLR